MLCVAEPISFNLVAINSRCSAVFRWAFTKSATVSFSLGVSLIGQSLEKSNYARTTIKMTKIATSILMTKRVSDASKLYSKGKFSSSLSRQAAGKRPAILFKGINHVEKQTIKATLRSLDSARSHRSANFCKQEGENMQENSRRRRTQSWRNVHDDPDFFRGLLPVVVS